MDRLTAMRWFWLGILNVQRYEALLEQFGTLEAAWDALNPALLKALGCKKSSIDGLIQRKADCDAEALLERCEREQTYLVSIEDDDYPNMLKEIADPPVMLSYCGDLSVFASSSDVMKLNYVALVGARAMSSYGRQLTEEIVPPLVRTGVVTVSGLAKGVDSHVATVTLDCGGKTVAVLGHGIQFKLSKDDASLARRIVEGGGVVMSEFPLDMVPQKYTFPMRNRIIAGLSSCTVVIQAGEQSGSLITARLALEYNRDVYAVPGSIFDPSCRGCHELIAKGEAKILGGPEEILSDLGMEDAEEDVEVVLEDAVQQAVFAVLSKQPVRVSEIQESTDVAISKVNTALTELELLGVVTKDVEGCWRRL